MSKKIDDYIDDIFLYVLGVIVTPIYWVEEKIRYYSNERKELLSKIKALEANNERLRLECHHLRSRANCFEIYQSENERLRKKLQSLGCTKKKINKWR